jgi:glycine/D-amino acid oxidase-like deaminating enzyme
VTGRIAGARVRDTLTGATVDVHARVVVNAGGPFADAVRRLAEPDAPPMLAPSAGVHVTLPDYYSPEGLGMIVPKTRDGRVVFMLPWQGETIAGTTDAPAAVTATPQPSEADIAFILDAISDYLTVKARLILRCAVLWACVGGFAIIFLHRLFIIRQYLALRDPFSSHSHTNPPPRSIAGPPLGRQERLVGPPPARGRPRRG